MCIISFTMGSLYTHWPTMQSALEKALESAQVLIYLHYTSSHSTELLSTVESFHGINMFPMLPLSNTV